MKGEVNPLIYTRHIFSSKCPSAPTKDSATPKQGKDAEDRHGGQV